MATADRAECGAADVPVVTPHGYGIAWAYTRPRHRLAAGDRRFACRSGEQGIPLIRRSKVQSLPRQPILLGTPNYARTTG
jgi:hypothetical protein